MLKEEYDIGYLVEVIDETSEFYQSRLYVVHKENNDGVIIYGLSGNKNRRMVKVYEVNDKHNYDEALKMANSLSKRSQIDRIFHIDQLKLIKKAE